MNANSRSQGQVGSPCLKQLAYGSLLWLGLSSPAHAVDSATASVAGWSIALVVILVVAYLFAKRKQ